MERPEEDSQSIIAIAYGWASTIIVIAVEMVVPGLLGLWLGHWLGAIAMILLATIGFALGTTLAVLHLLRLTKSKQKPKL